MEASLSGLYGYTKISKCNTVLTIALVLRRVLFVKRLMDLHFMERINKYCPMEWRDFIW